MAIGLLAACLCIGIVPARGQDATWRTNPPSGDYKAPLNWTPASVPTRTAFFGSSAMTTIFFSDNATVGGWTFNAGASDYTFDLQNFTLDFTGAGIIVNGGSVLINNGSNVNFFNQSTAGSATIRNSFLLTFVDQSTAGSATIENDGLVGFFDSATAGSATITNTLSGITIFGTPFGTDSPSAGHATITNTDFGTLEFNARATADHAIITNGPFSATGFFDFSTAGNATIITEAGGETDFFDNSTGGLARFITKAGGIVDFSGSLGPLGNGQISAGSIEGGGTYYIGGGNTLTVGGNNLTTNVSGVIADFNPCGCGIIGPGALVKVGTGTLTLSGTNTYTGGTTIEDGVLQLGAGGTTGSILGDVVDNAVFAIKRSDTYTFAGKISGTGSFEQRGTGTTIFTAANTYTGGTIVNHGMLRLGPGGSLAPTGALTVKSDGTFDLNGHTQTVGDFSGAGDVLLGAGAFTVGTANSTVFDGVISGSGSFTKQGSGTLTLGGISTYTGPTIVTAGGLIVNGSIADSSSLTMNPGTFLGGNGTVPTTLIDGATLSPGNSIGLITVAGNLTFVGAGNYIVEVSPAAADRTNVTGMAHLAGTLTLVPAAGVYAIGTTYTLLHADGGVSGTFTTADITDAFGPAVRASVVYDPNNVLLTLDANALTPLLPPGTAQNPRSVAMAIDKAVLAGLPVGPLSPLYFVNPASLPAALGQLSGEIATAPEQTSFLLMDQFLALMLDPFLESRIGDGSTGPALAFAPSAPSARTDAFAMFTKAPPQPFVPRWTVWGAAHGASGSFDGDPVIGSHDLSVRLGGFAAGADYRVSRDTVVGFAFDGQWSSFGLSNVFGAGSGDTVQAGLYASHRFDNAYVSAALAYGWHDFSTDRTVALPGVVDRLTADFNAQTVGARIETGYRFAATSRFGVTPFAAFQAMQTRRDAYNETGALGLAGFALGYDSETTSDTRSEIGLRFDSRHIVWGDALLTLRGRLGWGHAFDTDRAVDAFFQMLPVAGFTIFGASPADDFALVSAGAELKLANGWTLRGKFDGEFADGSQIYGGTGTLRITW